MHDLDSDAVVRGVEIDGDAAVLILDRSPFHPQGGGQPSDHGTIAGRSGVLDVADVRVVDGIVRHKGMLSGELRPGDDVRCSVDAARRHLLSRIHSAGHLVDMAVVALGLGWTPGRGYHFPDGPYVEYEGQLPATPAEEIAQSIEHEVSRIITRGGATSLRFVAADSGDPALRYLPPGLQQGEAVRVVEYGEFAIPCGGTHVRDLSEVGAVQIRRVKGKGATIRVAYSVPERSVI